MRLRIASAAGEAAYKAGKAGEQCFGLRAQGLGLGVQGLGFIGVWGLGFRTWHFRDLCAGVPRDFRGFRVSRTSVQEMEVGV